MDGLDLAVREGALGYVPQQLSADRGLTRREKRRPGLAAVGLADAADRLAVTCSGGMVRRLDLAEAWSACPGC